MEIARDPEVRIFASLPSQHAKSMEQHGKHF